MINEHPSFSLVGRRIGDYEVISLLGEGGQAKVYRARDISLGREVAIKVQPELWISDNELGKLYFRTGRYLEAEKELRGILELIPDNAVAYNNLGAMNTTAAIPIHELICCKTKKA